MAKIFDVQDWLKNHPNRNNFDLTHKVHGSYKMGTLYPILCKPVVPTDSFKIDTAVSLRFTPMPFPTQSNMRVIFHYFYVRTKNIWKNFPNWLQMLEEHTPPYIVQPKTFFGNGSLADHLDVPTSFHVSSEPLTSEFDLWFGDSSINYTAPAGDVHGFDVLPRVYGDNPMSLIGVSPDIHSYGDSDVNRSLYLVFDIMEKASRTKMSFDSPIDSLKFLFTASSDSYGLYLPFARYLLIYLDQDNTCRGYQILTRSSSSGSDVFVPSSSYFQKGFDMSQNPCRACFLWMATPRVQVPSLIEPVSLPIYGTDELESLFFSLPPSSKQVFDDGVISPYYGTDNTGDNTIKVSALPFRAYESIYNAFYRNQQGVQPFTVDGQTKYNQYNTTTDDGADSTDYTLMKRNWELDAYTSCLVSPQQGNVPYVGITDISALGRMRVETPDGHEAEVTLSDIDGGVEITNLHGDTPEARAYALRAASSGFTIPEFREANALQRFLEMNIRKGYRYLDFIEGHFGKSPKYSELDMAEFIGGFSQRISVKEVSNTNGVDTDSLGAIAGQARAIGGSKHGINHYFDDFGFVVGIMCIVPDNAYDCILPKHFNLQQPLDMYFPEFSQLSYMPLTHEELAPIQTVNDPRGSAYRNLTKVFGYQRPNHDLVWYPDTVHGLFRDATGIGDSVICRRFAARPDLSNDFLTIKPEETDTIFNYQFGDEDVALGEIVLDIKAKRPIPRLVVPQIS